MFTDVRVAVAWGRNRPCKHIFETISFETTSFIFIAFVCQNFLLWKRTRFSSWGSCFAGFLITLFTSRMGENNVAGLGFKLTTHRSHFIMLKFQNDPYHLAASRVIALCSLKYVIFDFVRIQKFCISGGICVTWTHFYFFLEILYAFNVCCIIIVKCTAYYFWS